MRPANSAIRGDAERRAGRVRSLRRGLAGLRAVALALGVAVVCFPASSPVAASAPPSSDGGAYKGWDISRLKIEGLDKESSKALAGRLSFSGSVQVFRVEHPPFFPQTLESDLRRTRLFMAQRGYPRATVTARFEPNDSKREVGVTLVVHAGFPVRIAGLEIVAPPPWDAAALGALLPLRGGSIFADDEVLEAGRLLELQLQRAGHARARVDRVVAQRDSSTVDLRYVLEPGPVYRFGRVLCDGVPEDLLPLVLGTVEIKAGRIYSPAALPEARNRLRLLGLFRQIRLIPAEARADTLDIRAELIPRDFQVFETGVGFWSDERLKLKLRWQHLNLLRAGRGFEAKAGYSRFLQSAAGGLWWPSLFGSRTRGAIGAELTRAREESYNLLSREITFGALYRFDLESQVQARLSFADIDLESLIIGEDSIEGDNGLLGILALSWQRSRTDDPVYPHRGSTMQLRVETGLPGSLSRSHYVLGEGAIVRLHPLPGDMVIAGRVGMGLAAPTADSSELLPNKRLYAGGAGSMRGFERKRLGPHDAAGVPTGGRARLEASLEVRFPLARKLRGALFVDAGQVWAERQDLSLGDLELAVGPAIFVKTPVGPLRADWGRLITDGIAGEPKSVFQISIGHPF